jgi:hypothetical protein
MDYENRRITIHKTAGCAVMQEQKDPQQEYVRISLQNLSRELQKFATNSYHFAPIPRFRDLWLDLDFDSTPFEYAVLRYIMHLLDRYYEGFSAFPIDEHC